MGHVRQEGCTLHLSVSLYQWICFSHSGISVFLFFFFVYCLALQEKIAKNSRRAAEDDMELVLREERQKTNELDVVVALCLSQVNTKT